MLDGVITLHEKIVMRAIQEYLNRRITTGNEIKITAVEVCDGVFNFDVEPLAAKK